MSTFGVFFGKTTPHGTSFQNSVPKVFTASPIDDVVLKFREIYPTGNRQNRALFTGQINKNFVCYLNCRYTERIAIKICQGQPPTKSARASPNNVLQISPESVHFRQTRKHRLCPEEYFHDSPVAMLLFGSSGE